MSFYQWVLVSRDKFLRQALLDLCCMFREGI